MAEISLTSIEEAYERVRPFVHRTRVFTCEQLNHRATEAGGGVVARKLYFKSEHEQKIGAFKIRGAVNAVSTAQAEYFVTQSSGNHAQAIALACKLLGKKAVVVMPEDSPSVKISAVRETYGAEVRLCHPTQEAREAMSAEVLKELGAKYGQDKAVEVHPNQDVAVICGQGTLAIEFLEQQASLDAIVVSIGGGGLISGIATYVKARNPKIKIIGAEPEKAKSAFMSKKAGQLVKNPPNTPIDTIADSVKSSLGTKTCPIVLEHVDAVFTATEEEIEDAMRFTMERAKQVIEPGCSLAVAVATARQLYEAFPELRDVGVVLCGGNVDMGNLPWMRRKRQPDGATSEPPPKASRHVDNAVMREA